MTKSCRQCQTGFEITDRDREFLRMVSPVFNGKRYEIPEPTFCPDCRQQRRLLWRNERHLYRRNVSGTPVVSIYSPDKPYTIISAKDWWGDMWDPLQYGMNFDFNRSFFDQFDELMRKVPRPAFLNQNCENSDYSPWMVDSKDCYLSAGGRFNEQCHYTIFPIRSEHCVDCSFPDRSRFLYECIDCQECYECFFSYFLENCSQCWFSEEMIGCQNCFGCVGLRRQQYHLFNEALSKEEYLKKVSEFDLGNPEHRKVIEDRVAELRRQVPHPAMRLINCENCSGDLIKNSRNIFSGFNVENCEDCQYLNDNRDIKNCADLYIGGFGCEFCYDGISFIGHQRSAFSSYCWESGTDVYYSDSCSSSQYLFGCIGLRHKQYCILNKQYTKEEYEALVPKIIEHMRQSGQWGEFFPVQLSPFCYNETMAYEYFPLSKEEVQKRGWKWNDFEQPMPEVKKIIPAERLPGSIKDIPDDILNWAIQCELTKKPFKIIPAELQFYRKFQLPIPRLHPFERHLRRMKKRPPRKLFSRPCAAPAGGQGKCQKEIQTTFSPDRPEKVYCEACYLDTV